MLRTALLIVAAVACALGLGAMLTGHPGGTPAAIWGGVLLVAIVFERWRYPRAPQAVREGWLPTEECFVDPESGKTLRVWYEPHTGARRYVDADAKNVRL